MPKKMRYDRQAILCLAADLADTADGLTGKRHAAGDGAKTQRINFYDWSGGLAAEAMLKDLPANSRLIILVHGDSKSTVANGKYSPGQLAKMVKSLLGEKCIQRISLHMCYGGGNKGTAMRSNTDKFTVVPAESFAEKFASRAGQFTKEVSARTDVVSGFTYTRGEGDEKEITNFERTVGGRRHAEGDKLVWTVALNSTIDAPVNPTRQWSWKEIKK